MSKAINHVALKAALAEQGMTQKQLATTIGVSSQAVTNWMKGKDFPRPPKLLKLAATLRLNFEQLVTNQESSAPVVAFRKKGNAKTTEKHIERARSIGYHLRPLVPFLSELQALRTLITSPSREYSKLEAAVAQTRLRLGIGETAILEYSHLISEFKQCGAILVPVMWGAKGSHENALHIRLPQEDVTFIFLNLDTHLEDFKFWMAHELAHVYTPDLVGTVEGEEFADAFAGALLFPKACAENAYREAITHARIEELIAVLHTYADGHSISLNTVYQQVQRYARSENLQLLPVQEKSIHAARNSNQGQLISEAIFDPAPPDPLLFITSCEKGFQSDFFPALKRMLRETETGASYIQHILNASLGDAIAIREALYH
ncbi:MAG: helix-turn-helix domain-containing protein [Pseudohongiellaceae bacterium]